MLLCFILFLSPIVLAGNGEHSHKSKPNKHHTKPKARDYQDDSIVRTPNGAIKGNSHQTVGLNKTYFSFSGIPYAEPPVGPLRFKPPVPAKPWNGTLESKERSACKQAFSPNATSEDCLYINVYSSNPKKLGTLYPVLVYLYGGRFEVGDSSYATVGPDYLLDEDIVFASFNYRGGIFGFLSTLDAAAPGNYGLKDQLLALNWIQNNIEFFGGDKNKVTIFGQSTGAISVSYHLLSPKSKGLFQGAIMQSGTALCRWGKSLTVKQTVDLIGFYLNVKRSTNQELVESLRGIDADRLLRIAETIQTAGYAQFNTEGLIFVPVVEPESEEAFITKKSYESFAQGNFNKVPTIIGYNSLEAGIDFTIPFRLAGIQYDFDITALVPLGMNVNSTSTKRTVGSKIKQYYWNGGLITLGALPTMQYFSDDLLVRPIQKTMVLQANHSIPVYFYVFSYEGIITGRANRKVTGVEHGEELAYLFRTNFNSTVEDRAVRSKIVKLWTNFAKFLNPTPKSDALLDNITWTVANSPLLSFLNVTASGELQVRQDPQKETIQFWDNLYQTYGNPPFDTY